MNKYTLKDVTEDILNEYIQKNNWGFKNLKSVFKNDFKDCDLGEYIETLDYDKILSKNEIQKLNLSVNKYYGSNSPTTSQYFDDLIVTVEGKQGMFFEFGGEHGSTEDNQLVFNSFSHESKLKLVGQIIVKDLNEKELNKKFTEIQNDIDMAKKFADETNSCSNLIIANNIELPYSGVNKCWMLNF